MAEAVIPVKITCLKKGYSGSESEIRALTTSLLASSASYFLISWQKPSRFFATTVEYFLTNISWCQLSEEQKWKLCVLLKICKNCKSFLTVKLLLFTVYVCVILFVHQPEVLCLYTRGWCMAQCVCVTVPHFISGICHVFLYSRCGSPGHGHGSVANKGRSEIQSGLLTGSEGNFYCC